MMVNLKTILISDCADVEELIKKYPDAMSVMDLLMAMEDSINGLEAAANSLYDDNINLLNYRVK